MSEDQTALFREEVARMRTRWNRLEVRNLGQLGKGGEWILLGLRAELRASKTDVGVPVPKAECILAGRSLAPPDEFGALIEQLRAGKLHSEEGDFVWPQNRKDAAHLELFFNKYERGQAKRRFGIDYSTWALEASAFPGNLVAEARTGRIDSALRAAKPPWNGLDDVRKRFLGFRESGWGGRDDARVEILAPTYLRLGPTTEIRGTDVHIDVQGEGTVRSEVLEASVIATMPDGSTRPVAEPNPLVSDETPIPTEWYVRFPETPVEATVHLLFEGVDVDTARVLGPVPLRADLRVRLMERFGVTPQDLRKQLAQQKVGGTKVWNESQQVGFLQQVLFVAGFSTVPMTGRDAPDLWAGLPGSGPWIVVDCTQREADQNNKITKTANRAKEIEALPGLSGLAVVATLLKRDEVNPSDEETAAREGVAILTLDDLEELVEAVFTAGERGEDVYQRFHALVPQHPPGLAMRRTRRP